jgi:hypothetical protein
MQNKKLYIIFATSDLFDSLVGLQTNTRTQFRKHITHKGHFEQ